MWIARDKDGILCIYKHKPSKGTVVWVENPQGKGFEDMYIIPKDYFPEVKWEDKEPRELILRPIEEK